MRRPGAPGRRLRLAGVAARIGCIVLASASCAPHPTTTSPAPTSLAALKTLPLAGSARPPVSSLVRPGAPLAGPDYDSIDLRPALAAFRASCPALVRRIDISELSRPEEWAETCASAASATDARSFFATALVPLVVGDGRGLDTGYYEPDLAASPMRDIGHATPLYRRPLDLVDVDLGAFDVALAGKHIRGRLADNRFVPYYDRGEIDDGALTGRGLELAWAADPFAAFFLEIQGSGRLRMADGTVLRIGYDGQNGHAYTGIGKVLRDRGALGPGQATMTGIIEWLRAHPADAPAVLRANRSKVFFRVLAVPPGVGPPGALGVPLTPRVSVAADPAFVPLGAPLWLDTTVAGAPFRAIVVAQDTGGAIRGVNRLDLFWGSGDAAGAVAGAITAAGQVTLLLPAAAAARALAAAAALRLRATPPQP